MGEEKNTNNSNLPGFPKKGLDRNRKIAVFFLFIFTLIVIIFWAINFKNSIKDPRYNIGFYPELETQSQDNCLLGDCLDLEDFDDNWFSDWEVSDSSNLNYEQDDDLLADMGSTSQKNELNTTSSINTNQEIDFYDNLSEQDIIDQKEQFEKILSGQADTRVLRQVLLESGMRQQDLDQISDKVLLEAYKEMIN